MSEVMLSTYNKRCFAVEPKPALCTNTSVLTSFDGTSQLLVCWDDTRCVRAQAVPIGDLEESRPPKALAIIGDSDSLTVKARSRAELTPEV